MQDIRVVVSLLVLMLWDGFECTKIHMDEESSFENVRNQLSVMGFAGQWNGKALTGGEKLPESEGYDVFKIPVAVHDEIATIFTEVVELLPKEEDITIETIREHISNKGVLMTKLGNLFEEHFKASPEEELDLSSFVAILSLLMDTHMTIRVGKAVRMHENWKNFYLSQTIAAGTIVESLIKAVEPLKPSRHTKTMIDALGKISVSNAEPRKHMKMYFGKIDRYFEEIFPSVVVYHGRTGHGIIVTSDAVNKASEHIKDLK